MDEKAFARKVNKYLLHYGYEGETNDDTFICTHCGKSNLPRRGKPDCFVLHPTQPMLKVEYKILKYEKDKKSASFPFSNIYPEQRSELENWARKEGHAYLGFGVLETREVLVRGETKEHDYVVAAYLIPWLRWLRMEDQIKPVQKSIPWRVTPSTRVKLRGGLVIQHMFIDYSFIHSKKLRRWVLQAGHPAIPPGEEDDRQEADPDSRDSDRQLGLPVLHERSDQDQGSRGESYWPDVG